MRGGAWLFVSFALSLVACGGGSGSGALRGPYQAGHAPESDQADCDAGKAPACMRLAAAYDSGRGVPADEARSQALFERACELGDYEGCVSLGVQLDARASTNPDGPKRAVELYRKACDQNVASGCLFLGYTYSGDGGHVGAPPDPALAASHFKKACELGSSEACTEASTSK